MKVLKKGPVWSAEYTCTGSGNGGGGCGALLLASQEDLYWTCHTDFLGGTHGHSLSFCCPECNIQSDVKNYNGPHIPKKYGRGN